MGESDFLENVDLMAIAREVLTAKQLAVWELDDRGFSQYQIATALDIGRGTVRDHLLAATRRIAKELRTRQAEGS
jgi:DNA-binding NarL/FixJ family response regulator